MPPSSPAADPTQASTIVTRTIYQMFIGTVTLIALALMVVYYLVPLPDTVRQVLYILDSLLTPILLYDFFAHVFYARNRIKYLITYGWLDLLGAIPGVPALRLARIPSLIALLRELRDSTPTETRMVARQRLAESTLLAVALIVIVVVTAGSILIVLVEAPVDGSNIKTGSDAVWWSVVTVSTVGYGDRFPVTNTGRLLGTFMIVMGVSLFSVLTSYIATQFMARRRVSGPSETELLRQEMMQQFEQLRRQKADEHAALRRELAQLQEALAALSVPPPPDHPR
jgi:voltage-gated potassium channel Kch